MPYMNDPLAWQLKKRATREGHVRLHIEWYTKTIVKSIPQSPSYRS